MSQIVCHGTGCCCQRMCGVMLWVITLTCFGWRTSLLLTKLCFWGCVVFFVCAIPVVLEFQDWPTRVCAFLLRSLPLCFFSRHVEMGRRNGKVYWAGMAV